MNFWKNNYRIAIPVVLFALAVLSQGCQNIGGHSVTPPEQIPAPQLGLMPGDTLLIAYSGPGAPEDFTAKIDESGRINVPPSEVGFIDAQGKSVSQIQQELQNKINNYYRQLLVNVVDVRFFYVRGEVNGQNRLQYQENLTLLSAIAAAQDFTPFANKNAIELTRDGRKYYLDAERARKDSRYDVKIYPRDTIEVRRRIL